MAVIPVFVHAETRPKYAGTVEATLLGAPALDPLAARTHADATAVALVFDTLYRIGPDGIAVPHLAVGEPVLDEKGTTVRIAIRKGVRFHDGTALEPRDVAASLERVRAKEKWLLAPVTAVGVDGDAITLSLRAPVADLTELLALPQTAVTKSGKAPGAKPIGSGPYAVDSIDPTLHRMQLRAFEDHFAGRPYVDLMLRWYDTPDGEVRKFETGAAQISARGVTAFPGAQPTYRAERLHVPAWVLEFVGFGQGHAAVTGDRAFRRALDLAIARGGLATINSGEDVVPVKTPLPGAPALPAPALAGELDAARAEVAKVPALAPDRIGAVKLEILVEDTRPDDRELAERVARALDQLGIATTIAAVPAADLRDRVAKGKADLWIGQLAEPFGFADAWWGAAFAVGGDDWPAAQLASGSLDPAAAAKAFADREPIVPLVFRGLELWHRSDVRGLSYDGFGRPCYADMFYFGVPVRTKP
ncbi:MAG TPA: ABC transporter substrate-binding protein [Kofleriaceae bacterium]|nr:ABC transporter substrate-binding protein [Kofleriaceae bacterium]